MGGFDDVSFQVWEEPEPPRRPRRHFRRVALTVTATALGVGALAAGASALTDSAKPAKQQSFATRQHSDAVRYVERRLHRMHHGPCPNMGGSAPASASLAPRD